MIYPFDQSFNLNLYCWNDGTRLKNLPAQTSILYVFKSKPTPEQIKTGEGAMQAIELLVSEITDSLSFEVEPINGQDAIVGEIYDYWTVTKLKLSTDGLYSNILRAIQFQKAFVVNSNITISIEDIKKVMPAIDAYLDDDELSGHIEIAKLMVTEDLKVRNIKVSTLQNLEDINLLVKLKTLEISMLSQIQMPADKFDRLADNWKNAYINALSNSSFAVTSQEGSKHDVQIQSLNTIRVIR